MKKFLIFIVLVAVLGLGYLFVKRQGAETPAAGEAPKVETPSVQLPLWKVVDDANMVMVASVGLGKEERRKVISGRPYLNLVQLLKVNGYWDKRETFAENCKEGARLEFYRDTVLLGEFRLTDHIGRVDTRGVWLPNQSSRLMKLNKFLKNNGAQFMVCNGGAVNNEEALEDPAADQRTVLTMPEFAANRKTKKKAEALAKDSAAVQDSVDAQNASQENAALLKGLKKKTRNTLQTLEELIMPVDTAVGEPLAERFVRMKRGSVAFFNEDDSERKEDRVELNGDQMKRLGELLSRTRVETFARFDTDHKAYSRITLFGENDEIIRLWKLSEKSGYLVKFHKGDRYSNFEGYWAPKNPAELQDFFANLK